MSPEGDPDRTTRFRRRRRFVAGVGVLGVGACFALAIVTHRSGEGVSGPGTSRELEIRDPPPRAPEDGAGRAGPSAVRPGAGQSAPPKARTVPIRIRVLGEGVAIAGAIVRVVEFDRAAHQTLVRSDAARTGIDGVAELRVEDGLSGEAWIEVASATTRGLRHAYEPFRRAARQGGEWEVSIPPAGRLELRVEGLPPDKMPAYVDVRFLTPDGGWEELFADLPATPVEDGGLFESRSIPRVQRVRLRADGTGEIPEVPADHGIYVEFPVNPDGWLVERSEFSGCSALSNSGEICRVTSGSTGVYHVYFRRSPSVRVLVEDALGAPIANAEVAVGVRHAEREGVARVFDTTSTTDASGSVELPLWTGTRLPDWRPVGLVIVAYAAGHEGRVIETEGGWYAPGATVRLPNATDGAFVIEGTLKYRNGTLAAGMPLRLYAAAPWNGDTALPALRATTGADGTYRIEVPEAFRPVYRYGRGLRIDLDSERLEAQPAQAMWRSLYPDLPRASTSPERFELPAPATTTRNDATVVLPP